MISFEDVLNDFQSVKDEYCALSNEKRYQLLAEIGLHLLENDMSEIQLGNIVSISETNDYRDITKVWKLIGSTHKANVTIAIYKNINIERYLEIIDKEIDAGVWDT